LLIFVWGCAPKRYAGEKSSGTSESASDGIIGRVLRNNLSEDSFYIEKASVKVNVNGESNKYLFNLKYVKPEEFLISIRSNTGIEGARVHITKDSVLINDRIGKRIIIGNLKDIDRISGFPYILFKILFGDLVLIGTKEKPDITILSNSVVIVETYNGKIMKLTLDPVINKVISATVITGTRREELTVDYSRFDKSPKHIPRVIIVKDMNRNFVAQINIEKIQLSWNGEIEFIPGKGYSKETIK
jgi:hypothetical protein